MAFGSSSMDLSQKRQTLDVLGVTSSIEVLNSNADASQEFPNLLLTAAWLLSKTTYVHQMSLQHARPQFWMGFEAHTQQQLSRN